MATQAPELDIDLFSDASLLDPFENYRRIRDAGPVVHLSPHGGVYALGRYQDVRAALANPNDFVSGHGVSLDDEANDRLRNTTLGSDDPVHARLRSVVGRPLAPDRLAAIRQDITNRAEILVERLVAGKSFDAVSDLATHLPVSVVADLVGLPDKGRERMLAWAAAAFDTMGPQGSPRTEAAKPVAAEMARYAFDPSLADRVKAGSWAAQLFAAETAGEISRLECGKLILDYLAPALDTTIFATANLIWLFARFPEQWHWLRENPEKIPAAINEVMRLESPITLFSRFVANDVEIEGVRVPKGSRAVMLYASANRDERKWENPEAFDIRRKSADHLAFGHSIHVCMGMNLAKLEITELLKALIPRVASFEIAGEPVRVLNNTLRGFRTLPIQVH